MRVINIGRVLFDHTLYSHIYGPDGRILFTRGTKLDESVIHRLESEGFKTLVISSDMDSDITPDPILSEGQYTTALKFMNDAIELLRNGPKDPEKAKLIDIGTLVGIANDIVDEVAFGAGVRPIDQLPPIKHPKAYDAGHAVAVGVLSAYCGRRMGFNAQQLRDLVAGGLLHDIGECFLPNDITQIEEQFTDEQFKEFQKHAQLGSKYLTRFTDVKPTTRSVCIQHHERASGKGYPKGLSGSQIHNFAAVVGACDVWDGIISDKKYRPRKSTLVAISILQASDNPFFTKEVREIIVRAFAPFPVGTWVTLSDGTHGIVKSVPKTSAARPDVKVVYDQNKMPMMHKVVSLSETPQIRVVGIPDI